MLVVLIIVISYLAGSNIFVESSLIIRILFKFGLVIVFPIALYPLNFYEEIEKQRISEIWSKWVNLRNLSSNLKKK